MRLPPVLNRRDGEQAIERKGRNRMAAVIRLTRRGKNKQPHYRLVAADKQAPRDGRYLEVLGIYDPRSKPPLIQVKEERVKYWIGKGATPSLTVKKLLKKASAGGKPGAGAAAA